MRTIILILLSLKLSAQTPAWFDDKAKHFYAGCGTSIIVGEIVYQTTDLEGVSSLIGSGAGVLITWGKEIIWDGMMRRGVKDFGDGVFGTGGSFAGGMIHRVKIDLYDKSKERECKKLEYTKYLLD